MITKKISILENNWQTRKLGEVCEVIAGQSPEGRFYNKTGNGLPFYQGKKEFTEKFIGEPTTWTTEITKEARAGDILMSVRAPVGPINLATQKICIGRGLTAIRASKEIDKGFLFNFLKKHENEIVGNAGAVFSSINKTQIENIGIPLPHLPEQKRIVKVLDEVFKQTTKAKENAEKNLQNARELFESYLQSVFANPGDEWEEKKLGDDSILKIIDGDRGVNYPKKSDFLDNGHCLFLNTKNVRPDGFSFDTTMFISKEKDNALRKGKLQRNDVILTTRGTIGNLAVYDKEVSYENIRINSGMLIFRPNVAKKKIVARLKEISSETKRLEAIYKQKLNNLDELKKSVLQKAFVGKL
ncbi:restriction endonuclease subunit S [bacterium]|nr:restriction endonuclease subunit S [bacterium]